MILLLLLIKKTVHDEIIKTLLAVDRLIKNVELFDVYEGKNLPEDKKSLAYHIVYQSPDQTLTTEDIGKVHEKVIKVLEKNFKAEIRK